MSTRFWTGCITGFILGSLASSLLVGVVMSQAPSDRPELPGFTAVLPTDPIRPRPAATATVTPQPSAQFRADPAAVAPTAYTPPTPAPGMGPVPTPYQTVPPERYPHPPTAQPLPQPVPHPMPPVAVAPAMPAPPAPPQTAIYRAKHMPVAELAEVVEEMKGPGGPMKVVAEAVTNSMVLTGPEEQLQKARELLEELDRQPATVDVEVAMIMVNEMTDEQLEELADGYASDDIPAPSEVSLKEVVEELKTTGAPCQTHIISLSTISNQPAFHQWGDRIANKKGEMENVGRILGVTPRVNGEGLITMEIDLEQSEMRPDGLGVGVHTIQTTVQLESGQTIRIGRVRQIGKEGDEAMGREVMVLLRAVTR